MQTYRKNLMVGLTVLVGLVLLAVMMVKFGNLPARLLAPDRIVVYFDGTRADGLSPGSDVSYLGVSCGSVDHIDRMATHVIIVTRINAKNPPPANVVGRIRSQLVGGGSNIALVVTGPTPEGKLARNATVQTEFVGVDVLPPEFASLADEMRGVIEQIRKSGIIDHLNDTIITTKTQIERAGKLMDTLQRTVGDDKMADDLRASLASMHTAMDSATRITSNLEKFTVDLQKVTGEAHNLTINANVTVEKTQAHIDEVARQMNDRLLQADKLLTTFNSISSKIDKGDGTAGQLINDPKLYQALVDSTRDLQLTIKELNLLVEQWKQEGVSFKLK